MYIEVYIFLIRNFAKCLLSVYSFRSESFEKNITLYFFVYIWGCVFFACGEKNTYDFRLRRQGKKQKNNLTFILRKNIDRKLRQTTYLGKFYIRSGSFENITSKIKKFFKGSTTIFFFRTRVVPKKTGS